jgi:tRNA A37 threonylcarbamoyladenosine dehydratase
VIESGDDDSPFNYIDDASGRAGITAHTNRLSLARVAIVGLGGTGSYVLDLVVKTPVREIHAFDGDWFVQHNAFRSPGLRR